MFIDVFSKDIKRNFYLSGFRSIKNYFKTLGNKSKDFLLKWMNCVRKASFNYIENPYTILITVKIGNFQISTRELSRSKIYSLVPLNNAKTAFFSVCEFPKEFNKSSTRNEQIPFNFLSFSIQLIVIRM